MKPSAAQPREDPPATAPVFGWLTPLQAAQELQVTRRFIDSRIADGELRVCRPSSKIVRISRAEWQRWTDAYSVKAMA